MCQTAWWLSLLRMSDGAILRSFVAVVALTAAVSLSLNGAARADDCSLDSSCAGAVTFHDGKLSVHVQDAELSEVLRQVAAVAGFQLKTTGQLGRVTEAFTDVSLEGGLRRLVRDHELMLVYRPSPASEIGGKLVEAHVFAGSPHHGPAETAAALAEINQLLRLGRNESNVARLSEFLSWSDPVVRTRAAQALGMIGGPAAMTTLARALNDQAPQVRLQAIHALRRLRGVQAIPALTDLLQRDPEASVKSAAIATLGTFREASAVAALKAALGDADQMVRQQAALALRRQGVALP